VIGAARLGSALLLGLVLGMAPPARADAPADEAVRADEGDEGDPSDPPATAAPVPSPTASSAPERTVEWDTSDAPLHLSLAYRGSGWTLLHPGLAARLDKPVLRRDLRVEGARRKLGFRHRTRDVFVGVDLGGSMRVNNHTLVVLQGVAGTRVTHTRGFTAGPTVGLGLSRAVLNHPAWVVRDDGSVGRRYLQGQWSVATSIGYEIGWDSQRRRETRLRRGRTRRSPLASPVQWFVRPTLTVLTPWMDLTVPVTTVDIGVRSGARSWGGRR